MWVELYSVFRFFVVFQQKTAYAMRISDWSSDVCSSDLVDDAPVTVWEVVERRLHGGAVGGRFELRVVDTGDRRLALGAHRTGVEAGGSRSEERRVGREGGCTRRARWARDPTKKTHNEQHDTSVSIDEQCGNQYLK